MYQHHSTTEKRDAAINFRESPENKINIHTSKKRLKKGEKDLIESAEKLLAEYLDLMAQGIDVTIMPEEKEVSSQEAAEILNVSRPYINKLLDNDIIPLCRKVGPKRKVLLKDVLNYKDMQKKRRAKSLKNMADIDQELGLDF